MALNATTLAAAIKTPIKAAHIAVGAADNAALDIFCGAIATGIAAQVVAHIVTNAVVAGTATGAMGGGPGVPVVGTIT